MPFVRRRLGVVTNTDRPHHRLVISGAVDLDRSISLRPEIEQLLSDRPSTIGLDLSEVTFIDCAGLGGLLWCLRRAQTAGTRVILCSPSATVIRLLTVTDSRKCFALAS